MQWQITFTEVDCKIRLTSDILLRVYIRNNMKGKEDMLAEIID